MRRIDRTARLGIGAALALVLLLTGPVWAETTIISAPDAQQRIGSGDLILLDIRSRQEWSETGLAKGAWPVSMHEPDFSERLQAVLAAYPADQIGLICATGGRTEFVTGILEKNGISGIIDVSEGMSGNPRGPGWLARGLATVSLDDAAKAYDKASKAWAQ